MNFRNTLFALYEETKATTIFAMVAYSEGGKPSIGFRRECNCSELKDPCIDVVSFMLCADAWNKKGNKAVHTLSNFMSTPVEDVEIRLRAVSSTYPAATITLGDYEIISRTDVKKNITFGYTEGVRLEIRRTN